MPALTGISQRWSRIFCATAALNARAGGMCNT
jgi:hypothetical protein